jgi:hypothetical protein
MARNTGDQEPTEEATGVLGGPDRTRERDELSQPDRTQERDELR